MVDDVEESKAAESEVSPLVSRRDEGTDKSSNNHDLVDQDDEKYSWPWHTRSQHEIHKQQRSRDKPIDVSHVEDLTECATDLGIRAEELDLDRSEAEIRTHGEVRDSSDENNTRSDVMEDSVSPWSAKRKTNESEACYSHNGANSEVPVRPSGRDCNVGCTAIDRVC